MTPATRLVTTALVDRGFLRGRPLDPCSVGVGLCIVGIGPYRHKDRRVSGRTLPAPRTYIDRRRLLEALAERTDRRVTAVVASSGFGKSVLIDQMLMDSSSGDGGGRHVAPTTDHLVACTSAHRHLSRMSTDLRLALGVAGPPAGSAEVEARILSDAIVLASPNDVTLILDDVHELGDSPSMDLVRHLLNDLPRNGHLVLVGHSVGDLPIARLAARGEALMLDEATLAFSDEEWASFAEQRNLDPMLDIRWPALAELRSFTGETEMVRTYLLEAVVQRLDAEQRWLLGSVIAVGGADDDLASLLVGRPVSVRDELHGISLVRIDRDGWAIPHRLWSEGLGDLVTARQRLDAIGIAAQFLADRRRSADAARLLVSVGAWTEASSMVLAAVAAQPPAISMDELTTWVDRLPTSARRLTGWRLASALFTYERSMIEARVELEELAQSLDGSADADALVAVLFHLGTIARRMGDTAALESVQQRLGPLAVAGSARAAAVRATVVGFRAQIIGDTDAGLSALAAVPLQRLHPEQQAHVLMMQGNLFLLAGETEAAMESYLRAANRGSPGVRLLARELCASARFVHGDTARAMVEQRQCLADAIRYGLSGRASQFAMMLAAMLAIDGQGMAATELLDSDAGATQSTDVETALLHHLARAVIAFGNDDATSAALHLANLPEPLGSMQRAYALAFGPATVIPHDRQTAFAQLSVGLMERIRRGELAHLRETVASNPFRHDVVSTSESAASAGDAGEPVDALLFGEPRLGRLDRANSSSWRRPRVRELLLLLAVEGPLTRDRIFELIWGAKDPTGSTGVLRVHVSYLHDVLEPERVKGTPATVLRDQGGRLALDPSFTTDVTLLLRHLDAASLAEQLGDPRSALDAYVAALRLRTAPLAVGFDAPWLDRHRDHLDARVVHAGLRAVDLASALGRADLAAMAAGRVVEVDEWNELAWRSLATARAALGDRLGALRAIQQALRAAVELDVDPDAETIALASALGLPDRRTEVG